MMSGLKVTVAINPEQAPMFMILEFIVSADCPTRRVYGPIVATEYRLNRDIRIYYHAAATRVNAYSGILIDVLLSTKGPDIALDSFCAAPC